MKLNKEEINMTDGWTDPDKVLRSTGWKVYTDSSLKLMPKANLIKLIRALEKDYAIEVAFYRGKLASVEEQLASLQRQVKPKGLIER